WGAPRRSRGATTCCGRSRLRCWWIDGKACAVGQYPNADITGFFSFYPFLQFVDFIKHRATNLRARGPFLFCAPALQRPRVVAHHRSNTTLPDESSLADN